MELRSILQHVEYKLALRGVHHKFLFGHLAVALGVDRFPERRKPFDGRRRGEYAIMISSVSYPLSVRNKKTNIYQ